MISKGLDFSNVGLVIVLNADSHLSFLILDLSKNLSDFNPSNR